jgi:hypothetical protein
MTERWRQIMRGMLPGRASDGAYLTSETPGMSKALAAGGCCGRGRV